MSNGSARQPGRPGRPGRLGLPARARGQRHRAGLDAGLAPALGVVAADPAGRQRPGRGPARRPDGQQRGRPPQPRRRPGGAAGPRAHLPEHPERRVLPARRRWSSSAASSGRSGGTLHLVGLLGPGRRARARPSPARLRRAGRAAPGAGHRHPRLSRRPRLGARPSAPRWSARCCSTCGGSPGRGWTSPR